MRIGSRFPFRLKLKGKLMLAFGLVSLIGYVAASLVLPRLYVWSQNREIDLANPVNSRNIRNYFFAITNIITRNSESLENNLGEMAQMIPVDQVQLSLSESPHEHALTPEDIRKWAKERGSAPTDATTSQQISEVEYCLRTMEAVFRVIRFLPRTVPPLSERISFLKETAEGVSSASGETASASGSLYVPILVPFAVGQDSPNWTLAVGGMRKKGEDPMLFDPDFFYTDFRHSGGRLSSASDVVFLSVEELKLNKPGLLESGLRQRDREYWEGALTDENPNQRFLFIPGDSLERRGDLAGLFCIVYEPPQGLFAWKELATSHLAYATFAIAALTAILISYFVARGIGRPIQELTQTAVAISEGHLDRKVEVYGRDEIGLLSRAFNEMTERLRGSLEELRLRAETIARQNEELDRRFNQLTALQNYTENVLATVDSAIFSVNLEGDILKPNPAAQSLLGVRDGQSLDDLPSETVRERLLSAIEIGEEIVSDETVVISPDGESIPVALSVSPLKEGEDIAGAVTVITDLQAIKKLEAIVSRQERLAALGQLTAGVAHELRNPLSIIKACAEILHLKFSGHADEKGLTSDIILEVDRLSRVVTEFLTFARPSQPNRVRVGLNELLSRNIDLLERSGNEVCYERKFEESLPDVEADAEQIEQVVLNLVRNGIEAMQGSGTITISTGHDPDAGRAWFEIRDHGEGIGLEAKRKIFDPFFTTKAEGTGLGLSICHKIIESHEGSIEVSFSMPGEGTAFKVSLPAIEKQAAGSGLATAETGENFI